jgi:hypothetical protein
LSAATIPLQISPQTLILIRRVLMESKPPVEGHILPG